MRLVGIALTIAVGLSRAQFEVASISPMGWAQLGPMLQALLAERFKLVVRRETKAVGGFALVAAKAGVKTGIRGVFEMHLQWAARDGADGPSIFTALHGEN